MLLDTVRRRRSVPLSQSTLDRSQRDNATSFRRSRCCWDSYRRQGRTQLLQGTQRHPQRVPGSVPIRDLKLVRNRLSTVTNVPDSRRPQPARQQGNLLHQVHRWTQRGTGLRGRSGQLSA